MSSFTSESGSVGGREDEWVDSPVVDSHGRALRTGRSVWPTDMDTVKKKANREEGLTERPGGEKDCDVVGAEAEPVAER